MSRYPSLKKGLILNSLLLAILPVFIVGSISLYFLTDDMKNEIMDRNFIISKSLAGEIERFLRLPNELLGHVGEVIEEKDIIKTGNINRYIRTIRSHYGFFNIIEIADMEGSIRYMYPYDENQIGLDISSQRFFRIPKLLREPYWSNTFISALTDEPTVVLSRPTEDHIIIGYLNLSSLYLIIKKVRVGKTGRAFIVDRTGTLIAHPIEKLVKQRWNLNNIDLIKNALQGLEGRAIFRFKDKDVLGACSIVPGVNWAVVVIQSVDEAFSSIHRIRIIFICGAIFALLCAIIISIINLKTILNPLTLLVESAKRIASGDYKEKIRLRGYRELNELGEDFNIMADAIRKREEALKEAEARYRSIFENTGAATVIIDEDTTILMANNEFEKLSGYKREEIEGKRSWIEFVVKEDLEKMKVYHYARREDPESTPTLYEFRFIDKSGNIKHVLNRVNIIPGERSSIASLMDITEIKKEEARRILLETAIEQSAEIVVITDRDGNIVYVNPSFEKITGYERNEAIGQNPRILKSGKHNQAFYEDLWNTILSGNVWKGHFINRNKQGELYEEEAVISPVKDASGNIINFVAVKRDVTTEIEMEKRLRQAQKMEAIGTLAGGIAHDFNNILSVIMGYAEISEMKIDERDIITRNLKEIIKATGRAKELVQQILTFSRGMEEIKKPISIKPILKESVRLLRSSIPSYIKINHIMKEDPGIIEADPTQIQQILMNLCTNAAHAMRKEGGMLDIRVMNVNLDEQFTSGFENLIPGPYVMIEVSDTGEGMSKETVEKIFDPYFTTKEKGVGTGLGLAVVQGIVNKYKGAITVESELGKGSIFRVYLPIVISAKAENEEIVEHKILPTGNERILFVDDEQDIVNIGKQMLEYLGYRVTATNSPIEALRLFQDNPDDFDLVITDMTMPHLPGDKLAEKLKDIRSDIPVIICTGYSDRIADEQKAKEMGITGYIMKPFVFHQFAQAIRRILDNNGGNT